MAEDRRRSGQMEADTVSHQLTLAARSHLALDGARNVINFSNEEILVETTAGALVIRGADLHIQQLNLDEGRLVVDGNFASLAYLGDDLGKRGKHFLHRLLR